MLPRALTRLVDPGVPEPVDPAALRRVAWMALVLDAVLVSGNIATRFALGPKGDAAVYEVFLAWNLPGHAVMLAALVTLLRSSCELPAVRGRLLIVLAAWAWTVAPSSWMIGGIATTMNLGFATILVGGVRLYLGGRLGAWTFLSATTFDALFGVLRVAGALPDRSPLPEAYLMDDAGRAAAVVLWRAVVIGGAFTMAAYAANRYRTSEHELRTLNGELEDRVATQVAQLVRTRRLRRYLAPQLVDELLAADEDPAAQRDRRPITVFFCDLRGFTGLVERLPPEDLATVINRYFDEVTQIAFRHGGTVDKFIGDAVMIVFGAPRATGEADQARRCVAMAREIQRRLGELHDELAALGAGSLAIRIGIGSGVATVGTFGAAHRADYTAVGVPVNRAARLEPLAPPGGILIDGRTRALLGDADGVEEFGELSLKGFTHPEPVFRVHPDGDGAGADTGAGG
ncbi:MAG: adenylate/guanylate cyclase domain-containing protein [Kofleriaceae bacterium]|nr:adenylate/guanylate cyclase domain-containing protein [Myxococcales bacterium]MCB9564521.1 adenylate/guanylate cyclase domain-containing protein [Kofleriaceae bacterium]